MRCESYAPAVIPLIFDYGSSFNIVYIKLLADHPYSETYFNMVVGYSDSKGIE